MNDPYMQQWLDNAKRREDEAAARRAQEQLEKARQTAAWEAFCGRLSPIGRLL